MSDFLSRYNLCIAVIGILFVGCTHQSSSTESSSQTQPDVSDVTDTSDTSDTAPQRTDSRDTAEGDGSSADVKSLDKKLTEVKNEGGFPALAAIVFDQKGIIAEGYVGTRKLDGQKQIGEDDAFHLGSIGKSMTATVAGRLIDDGQLEFQDTLPELLPNLADQIHEDYKDVTLLQLMRHEAGLPTSIPRAYPDMWRLFWERGRDKVVESRQAFAAEVLGDPAPRQIGTYNYANASYIVLGAILEQKTGESWETLIKNKLFEPLDMTNCGFGAPATPGSVDAPWGHRKENGSIVPVPPGPKADNPPATGPAGTIHCPPRSWMRFAQLHLGQIPNNFISEKTLDQLHTSSTNGPYAGGWLVAQRDWAGGRALNHGGSNTMFYALTWLAPEQNKGFLITTNVPQMKASQLTDQLAVTFIEMFFE
jgi:CubicO group peptidase (beta-lactamase class C family)